MPTPDDFAALAEMQALAFAEKGVKTDNGRAYKKYYKEYPNKIQHCRIAKSTDHPGVVLGAIQLQMKGDPGDLHMPGFMRHELRTGEAYVEFIACHPNHTGKGVGSRLLSWADTYAREEGIKFISLEVMSANEGAIRLYERKGFVIKRDPHIDECDACLTPLITFCCFGCRYCGVLYMEKATTETPSPIVETMARGEA